MAVFDDVPSQHYLGLVPWSWVQFDSDEAPGPFPYVGGLAAETAACLQEAHRLLLSAIETAISDIFSHRAPVDDPGRRIRLEDA